MHPPPVAADRLLGHEAGSGQRRQEGTDLSGWGAGQRGGGLGGGIRARVKRQQPKQPRLLRGQAPVRGLERGPYRPRPATAVLAGQCRQPGRGVLQLGGHRGDRQPRIGLEDLGGDLQRQRQPAAQARPPAATRPPHRGPAGHRAAHWSGPGRSGRPRPTAAGRRGRSGGPGSKPEYRGRSRAAGAHCGPGSAPRPARRWRRCRRPAAPASRHRPGEPAPTGTARPAPRPAAGPHPRTPSCRSSSPSACPAVSCPSGS